MTQPTSIQTYHAIRDNGLLSNLRFKVYDYLYSHPRSTISECCHFLEGSHHNLSPRFAELKRLGVILEDGTRFCAVTGRECIAWATTDQLPVKLDPVKSKNEIIKELEAEIERLKKELAQEKSHNPMQIEFWK